MKKKIIKIIILFVLLSSSIIRASSDNKTIYGTVKSINNCNQISSYSSSNRQYHRFTYQVSNNNRNGFNIDIQFLGLTTEANIIISPNTQTGFWGSNLIKPTTISNTHYHISLMNVYQATQGQFIVEIKSQSAININELNNMIAVNISDN